MAQRVGDKIATQLYQAAMDTEEQLDNEIERLEKLNADDLEEIRRKRLEVGLVLQVVQSLRICFLFHLTS